MTPKLVEVYRKIPVVRDNPNLWMIEILDCFVLDLCNLEVMKHSYDNNIFSIR